MESTVPRGRFVWADLLTTDPVAAQSFYTKVTGWTVAGSDARQSYRVWENRGTGIGGVTSLPDNLRETGAPPHWLPYIGVSSVAETAARTKALGGAVHVEPRDIPSVGRFAVLGDLQGVVFAVLTPPRAQPDNDGPSAIGEFSWHELMTTDHEKAFDFYHDLFGWEKTGDFDMGPDGTYQLYGREGSAAAGSDHAYPLGGMFNKPDAVAGPAAWILYVKVEDIEKSKETVEREGGRIVNGPMEVPGGDWIVQCTDPQGGFFALHQAAREG
jgi:hypothetical protein